MKKSSAKPSSLAKLSRNRFRQGGVGRFFEEISKIFALDPKVPGTADVNNSDTGHQKFEETSKNFKVDPKVLKKFDVNGTRRRKVRAAKCRFQAVKHNIIPPLFHRGATTIRGRLSDEHLRIDFAIPSPKIQAPTYSRFVAVSPESISSAIQHGGSHNGPTVNRIQGDGNDGERHDGGNS